MSWRAGAELFADVWPLIQARVRDKRLRREFTTGLLRLLVEHDVDPADVADIHPEIRSALAAIGAEPPPEGDDDDPDADVANCIRQLGHADPAARASAAEALRHFVSEAGEPGKAAAAALTALVPVFGDATAKVRREAAMSIRALIRAGHPVPPKAAAKLRAAASHDDEVVAKRVREALAAMGG